MYLVFVVYLQGYVYLFRLPCASSAAKCAHGHPRHVRKPVYDFLLPGRILDDRSIGHGRVSPWRHMGPQSPGVCGRYSLVFVID